MALTESTMLDLGTIAPDFTLTDVVSGRIVRRDDFRGKKALLVAFICAHCPYVNHLEKGLAKLAEELQDEPVGIVAISSNDIAFQPEDSPDKLKAQALACGFNFPYLYDETQDARLPLRLYARLLSVRRGVPPGLSRAVRLQPPGERHPGHRRGHSVLH